MQMPITYGLARNAARNPDGIAFVHGNVRRCWSEVVARVARFAGALEALGVRRGDRVCLLAENCAAGVEACLAVPWAGAIIASLNTRWTATEKIAAVRDCAPRVLLVDSTFLEQARALQVAAPAIEKLVWIGADTPPAGVLALEQLIAAATPVVDARLSAAECFAIFYTSGTTGRPKGVMITAAGCHLFGLNLMIECLQARHVVAHSMPLSHLGGAALVFAQVLAGARGVLFERFDADGLIEAVASERITHTLWLPAMIRLVLGCNAFGRHDLSSLEHILYGGAPIPRTLLGRMLSAFPGVKFWQGYSMTEASGITTMLTPADHDAPGPGRHRLRSAGRAAVGVELQIVGADGAVLAPGRPGEICVRGPVCLGYWNQPAMTHAAIRDGWLHTGDGGSLDGDGYLYVLDRIDDMIFSGGESIHAVEVETIIMAHAEVGEAAVVGLPDERWGEAVTAIVRRRPGTTVSGTELVAHCRTVLASHKCPRRVIFRDGPFPLNGAGKVLKTELRRLYAGPGGES